MFFNKKDEAKQEKEQPETLQELLDGFMQSQEYELLTKDEQNRAAGSVDIFSDYMENYEGCSLNEWTPQALQIVCTEILPKKLTAEEKDFRAIAPSLRAFFQFAQRIGFFSGSLATRLTAELNRAEPIMMARSQSPQCWGMAKTFAMKAQKSGAKTKKDFDMFMMTEQLASLAQLQNNQNRVSGASLALPEKRSKKTGRNESCPCGSGKKYKKCCLDNFASL